MVAPPPRLKPCPPPPGPPPTHTPDSRPIPVAGAGPLVAALVRQHEAAVCSLAPMADHCRQHHAGAGWRQAAALAFETMQQMSEQLYALLAARVPDPSLDPLSALLAAQARELPAASVSTAAAEAVEAAEAAAGRLVAAGVARARSGGEAIADARSLEELERQAIKAFQAALDDPLLVPQPYIVLHEREVRDDPILSQEAVPATPEEVAVALQGRHVDFEVLPGYRVQLGPTAGCTRAAAAEAAATTAAAAGAKGACADGE